MTDAHDDSVTVAVTAPHRQQQQQRQQQQHVARVVRADALFMWPEVASFCSPRQVCTLERVCRDVAAVLHAAETGTRVMQRYWNAQWARLLWPDDALSRDKRLLLPSSLSRSEGRKSWRAMYAAEYPLWLQRHFRGHGVDNNAVNEARVRFRRETLNEVKSADELAALELTVHEAMLKAMVRRGVTVSVGDARHASATSTTTSSPSSSSSPRANSNGNSSSEATAMLSAAASAAATAATASSSRVSRGNKREDKKLARVAQRTRTSTGSGGGGGGMTREDYHMDQRQGTRKGKHAKGMGKKWSSFNDVDDFDY